MTLLPGKVTIPLPKLYLVKRSRGRGMNCYKTMESNFVVANFHAKLESNWGVENDTILDATL